MGDRDRLDSWKEIAAHLRRGVRTAQRWEREAGLPVRRVAGVRGGVYAFRADIDAWWQGRSAPAARPEPDRAAAAEIARATSGGTRETRVRPFLSHDVRVDPDSASGHANMAVYFFTLAVMGLARPDEGVPAARAAARRALHLDPAHAEAQAIEAVVLGVYDRDWAGAERRFALALAREPVPSSVRFHYSAWFLSPLQRHAESLAQLRHGLASDPLYLLGRAGIGGDLCSLGQVEAGCAELEDVLRIDPQFGPALGFLGRELALQGRADRARELAERTYASIPRHPNAAGFLAGMLHAAGEHARAREVLAALASESEWSLPRARAESHLVRGEMDGALDCIAGAVALKDPGIWLLFAGSAGARLRARARWQGLRAALKLR